MIPAPTPLSDTTSFPMLKVRRQAIQASVQMTGDLLAF